MQSQSHQKELILASGSTYRQALLARLCVPFVSQSADVDESPLAGEDTLALTRRLALLKAGNIAHSSPSAFVIGSDQLADLDGCSVGKPGDEESAVAQLLRFSGRCVRFHTSVALICRASGFEQLASVPTEVEFRHLEEAEVRRYVTLDKPLDCSGAFRSEAAGPALLRSMSTRDPTAIIGLPLIALARMLRQAGFSLP